MRIPISLRWLVGVSLISLGCQGNVEPVPEDDAHDHVGLTGPNGGPLFDLGVHHAELVRHSEESWELHLLDDQAEAPISAAAEPVAAYVHSKSVDLPARTIPLNPVEPTDDRASTFRFDAPEEYAGHPMTVIVPDWRIDGKREHLRFDVEPSNLPPENEE